MIIRGTILRLLITVILRILCLFPFLNEKKKKKLIMIIFFFNLFRFGSSSFFFGTKKQIAKTKFKIILFFFKVQN